MALTATQLKNLPKGKDVHDRDGLFARRGARDISWTYRYTCPSGSGKRIKMGIGRWPDMSLADARTVTQDYNRRVRQGVDPRADLAAAKIEEQKEKMQGVTFRELAELAYKAKEAQLSTPKRGSKYDKWFCELKNHALPKIGNDLAESIDRDVIERIVAPLWHKHNSTAEKLMSKFSVILNHGFDRRMKCDGREVEAARRLMGKTSHVPRHHPSVPTLDAPFFYESLDGTVAQLALKFMILTAGVRSGNIRYARWGDIDLENKLWRIPRLDMKTKSRSRDHVLPLSPEALDVLEEVAQFRSDESDLIFYNKGSRTDDALSSNFSQSFFYDNHFYEKLTVAEEREGLERRIACNHGLRRTCVRFVMLQNERSVVMTKALLDHKVADDVFEAYWNDNLSEDLRPILDRWGRILTGKEKLSAEERKKLEVQ